MVQVVWSLNKLQLYRLKSTLCRFNCSVSCVRPCWKGTVCLCNSFQACVEVTQLLIRR